MCLRDELQFVPQLLHSAARREGHHPFMLQVSAKLRFLLPKVSHDVCVALALQVEIAHTTAESWEFALHLAKLMVQTLLHRDVVGGGRLDGSETARKKRFWIQVKIDDILVMF